MLKKFKNMFVAREQETTSTSYGSSEHEGNEPEDRSNYVPKSSHKSYHAQQKYVKKTVINVENNTKGTISQGNKVVNIYNGVGRTNDSEDKTVPGVHFGGSSVLDGGYKNESLGNPVQEDRRTKKLSKDIASCTLELSVDNKYLIADNLGEKWKRFARMLPEAKFTDTDIYSFEQNNLGNQCEAVICVLNRWGERAPEYATVGEVAKVLEKIGLLEVANKLMIE